MIHTETAHEEELLAKSSRAGCPEGPAPPGPGPGEGLPAVLQAPVLLPGLSSNPSNLNICRDSRAIRAAAGLGEGVGGFLEEGAPGTVLIAEEEPARGT